MAMKRARGDAWEYTFKRAGVLDKPLYLTFQSEAEGDLYAARLEALLDRGIVPTEHQTVSRITNITALVDLYLRDASVTAKDRGLLDTVTKTVGLTPLASITANWVDNWITDMKRVHKLAPATIRSKIGSLARCTDWGIRKKLLLMPDHPLRTLPNGYAQYTELDTKLAGVKRVDIERDRRLEPDEHEKILQALTVGVLARKQRPYHIEFKAASICLYTLAIESAMRLREMYTLTTDQVDVAKRTVFLDKTKNGDKRQVPLSSGAVAALKVYLEVRILPTRHANTLVFPWWSGEDSAVKLGETSDFLSKMFMNVFKEAGCAGLKFHDLRHEATSRLFERTTLSDTEIMKITGHKTHRMIMRYANLRASDLADKLWGVVFTSVALGLLSFTDQALLNIA